MSKIFVVAWSIYLAAWVVLAGVAISWILTDTQFSPLERRQAEVESAWETERMAP